jgi:hypothetical protein
MKKFHALVVVLCMAATASASAQQSQAVRVDSMQAESGGGLAPVSYIVGSATNVTDKRLKAVFLNFNLYDSQNTLVGNTNTFVNDLDAGGAWQFRAPVTMPYHHFTLVRVNAYNY